MMSRATKLAALAALAALAIGGVRRHQTVARVAPELRVPSLWLPLSIGSRLELAVGRRTTPASSRPVAGVTVVETELPSGGGVVVYKPESRASRGGALLWIHGGGTVLGFPEADHELCSRMARDLGIIVVSVRYRLAPEHPFPAGLDDCTAALRWLVESSASLSVDTDRIAVGGASAGGGLAASLAQRAYDSGLPVAFQLLVYPMLDDRTALIREHGRRGRHVWTPRSNRWAWSAYLGHRAASVERRPYAAPARRADLSGLPPAWIGVGSLDLFYAEDVAYARRLSASGVPVRLHVQPRMYHGADAMMSSPTPITSAFQQNWFNALADALAVSSTDSASHGELKRTDAAGSVRARSSAPHASDTGAER